MFYKGSFIIYGQGEQRIRGGHIFLAIWGNLFFDNAPIGNHFLHKKIHKMPAKTDFFILRPFVSIVGNMVCTAHSYISSPNWFVIYNISIALADLNGSPSGSTTRCNLFHIFIWCSYLIWPKLNNNPPHYMPSSYGLISTTSCRSLS